MDNCAPDVGCIIIKLPTWYAIAWFVFWVAVPVLIGWWQYIRLITNIVLRPLQRHTLKGDTHAQTPEHHRPGPL